METRSVNVCHFRAHDFSPHQSTKAFTAELRRLKVHSKKGIILGGPMRLKFFSDDEAETGMVEVFNGDLVCQRLSFQSS